MTEYIVDLAAHNASAAMALCDGVHGEIVRCRDCRYHVSVTDGDVCRKPCGDETAGRVWVEPDGFCAWGKPRSK